MIVDLRRLDCSRWNNPVLDLNNVCIFYFVRPHLPSNASHPPNTYGWPLNEHWAIIVCGSGTTGTGDMASNSLSILMAIILEAAAPNRLLPCGGEGCPKPLAQEANPPGTLFAHKTKKEVARPKATPPLLWWRPKAVTFAVALIKVHIVAVTKTLVLHVGVIGHHIPRH